MSGVQIDSTELIYIKSSDRTLSNLNINKSPSEKAGCTIEITFLVIMHLYKCNTVLHSLLQTGYNNSRYL